MFNVLSIILPQIEQHTEEQKHTDVVSEEFSELDTTQVLESAQEATQSKESVPLSLVDGAREIIVEDSIPDGMMPAVTVEDEEGEFGGKDGFKKSTSDITIQGWIFGNHF